MILTLQASARLLYRQAAVIGLIVCLTFQSQAQSWLSALSVGSGTNTEVGRGACTDNAGNVYYIGTFTGTADFDPGGAAANLVSAGFADVFITKYNSAGVFQWAVRGGGGGQDVGAAIATDGTNIYAIGNFSFNAVTPANFGPFNPTSNGTGTDVWVAKLDANGTYTAVTSFGSTNLGDNGQGICTDPTGNVYISGTYNTTITFGGTPALNVTGGSGNDMFIVKLNASLVPQWSRGGGSTASFDNGGGGAVCYHAALNEVIAVGCYNATAATYGSVTLPNSGGNEIAIVELDAATGNFLHAVSAGGGGAADDEALGVCYDATTQDVLVTGYFNGNIQFGATPALTNGGQTDFYVTRYSPASDTYIWAAAGGGTGMERSSAIANNGSGSVAIAGQFSGTLTFGASNLSAPGTLADPMVASFAIADGTKEWAAQGSGNGGFDDLARGITFNTISKVFFLTGQFSGAVSFGSFNISAVGGIDIFFARLAAPLGGTVNVTPPTCNNGCNGSATVTVSGGVPPYTYLWAPSGGTGATASGLCVGNYTVTVTDFVGASIVRNATISLPAVTMTGVATNNNGFIVNANNTVIADASCRLIATLVPIPAAQVAGATNARVWIEPSVPSQPVVNGTPFVARHYEITPLTNTGNATGRVTLYFSQQEFTDFNNHPNSTLDLPGFPTDNAGKANLRIAKYPGTSTNGTGWPYSYNSVAVILDPVDGDIVWNATANRWEVSVNVTGFSGFVVQTSLTALPVTWLRVIGTLSSQSKARLTWEVEERMVADYTIERSKDGTNFSDIGTIASQGDGTHSYQYEDAQTVQGNTWYRIRQTDRDGRSSNSKIVLLKGAKHGSIVVYPNPTRGTVTLNITDASLFNTTAHLYDVFGRELQRIRISESVTAIDLGRYGAGVYLLRLRNGETFRLCVLSTQ